MSLIQTLQARLGETVTGLREPSRRRRAYAVAALIFAVFTVFPRHYLARVKILPQDGSGAGLGAILGSIGGGLQNFASLLSTHQTIEVYLLISRSHDVVSEATDNMHLVGRPGFGDLRHAQARLMREVDVHALTGGVLEVVAKDDDPAIAKELAEGYAATIQNRITDLARQQTVEKKAVVTQRIAETTKRLADAEAALNRFQAANKLAAPEAELGAAVVNKAGLQAKLQAKLVELQTARQFGTDENVQVQSIQTEVTALRQQISIAESQSKDTGPGTLGGMALKSTEYLDLYRDLKFAEALYEVYTRYLEQVTVEELANTSQTNVQVIESAFVDPHVQLNNTAAGLLLATLLLALYTEAYLPLSMPQPAAIRRRRNEY